MKHVMCDYCGKRAELVDGSVVYPNHIDLREKLFWYCAPCRAWVGVHKGTARPLGRLADYVLRKAKIRAHAAFDPLFNRGEISRQSAYKWLSESLGISSDLCHIGMFDLETCSKVVEVCKKRNENALCQRQMS